MRNWNPIELWGVTDMGFALFIVSMVALAMMSTTKESRAEAREQYAYMRKYWRIAGLISWGIITSFFIF